METTNVPFCTSKIPRLSHRMPSISLEGAFRWSIRDTVLLSPFWMLTVTLLAKTACGVHARNTSYLPLARFWNVQEAPIFERTFPKLTVPFTAPVYRYGLGSHGPVNANPFPVSWL